MARIGNLIAKTTLLFIIEQVLTSIPFESKDQCHRWGSLKNRKILDAWIDEIKQGPDNLPANPIVKQLSDWMTPPRSNPKFNEALLRCREFVQKLKIETPV